MITPERRPLTSFYTDINHPDLAQKPFEAHFAAIREYVSGLPAVNLESPELDPEIKEFLASGEHHDYIIHVPNSYTYVYEILDRGNNLYQTVARQGGIDFNNRSRVRGTGKVADSVLDSCLNGYPSDYIATSSDGLLIEGPYHPMVESQYSESVMQNDTGEVLFKAGLSRVFAHEVVFDENGTPAVINGDLQHYQYGVETLEGFVPMITILSNQHPVINAWRERQQPADGSSAS
jgi:hypothetical protein